MKRLVIYHGNCVDGTAAAVAHRIAYERGLKAKNEEPNALLKNIYKKAGYGDLENDAKWEDLVEDYNEIFFLDFCPSENRLRKLLMEKRTVTIIDHHKTGMEMIRKRFDPVPDEHLRFIFSADNKLSGATLTWLIGLAGFTAQPKAKSGRDIEIHKHKFFTNVQLSFIREESITLKDPLYNLIGIRDTWDLSNPEMKEKADNLSAYINFNGLIDFEKFYQWVKDEEWVFNGGTIDYKGSLILEMNNHSAKNALKDSHQIILDTYTGKKLAVVIGSCPSFLGSQFGENWRLQNEGMDTIAIALFFSLKNNSITLGIRSSGVEGLKLAQSFEGGGGHPHACGCRLDNVAIPFEHIGNGATDNIEWIKYELVERIKKLYVEGPLEGWVEIN